MATKTHEITVTVGEYKDRDGNTKKRYQSVGALMQGDNGLYIMLAKWFNPAGVVDSRGGESILLSCFEPRQQQAAPQQRNTAPQSQASDDYSQDIPF